MTIHFSFFFLQMLETNKKTVTVKREFVLHMFYTTFEKKKEKHTMATLLTWDLFPQHDRTHILELCQTARGWVAGAISSANPWGAADDLRCCTSAAAYSWLTPLSPRAEAPVRTWFRLLINPAERKVCVSANKRVKMSPELLLPFLCLSLGLSREQNIIYYPQI